MSLNNLLEVNSSELGNHIIMIAISLYIKALVRWCEKNNCIALLYEQTRQNTNTSPASHPHLVFFPSEAVDETKPKESARQEEDKEEEREVDQEHA